MSKSKTSKLIIILIIIIPLLLIGSFFAYTGTRASQFSKIDSAPALTSEESYVLEQKLSKTYEKRQKLLQSLPYEITGLKINIKAESAILIDVSNGNVLFEKNSNKVIPPASMTKLFTMYVVDQEVASGRLNYDDIIPLPPESWACNMPPHSSLMFLGKDQVVTLEELLLGLSICSGNDAAYAIAYAVSGSMEEFVNLMNQTAIEAGLTHTHFVESSGYSELNTTTAREMAAFCRLYLTQHPDSLKKFHSVREFTYPKPQNMAPGDKYGPQDWSNGFPEHITMGITQQNTNPLLDILPGCDGLKTGYIDESGYNLALTAVRNGTRFLSITMKGPGRTTAEGQENRIADGTALMEKAFSNFKDYSNLPELRPYFVKVYKSNTQSIYLKPAFEVSSVCVPLIPNTTLEENINNIKVIVDVPKSLSGEITAGEKYGDIKIMLDNYLLDQIPLVADRSTKEAGFITRLADSLIIKK